jgi:Rrf2 family iron-sulfur cluster assembly transcriptional regulator
MRINKDVVYSLGCLLEIAKAKNKPVNLKELARIKGISVDYAEQLLIKLKRKKIIKSIRGLKGGYLLLRKPQSITLKDIIEAQDSKVLDIVCFKQGRASCNLRRCNILWVWKELEKKLKAILSNFKLSDLLKEKVPY